MRKRNLILLSPLAMLALSNASIRIAERFLGVWAWVPWIIIYWGFLFILVLYGGGTAAIRRWMAPPTGSWLWSALAILLALPALTMLLSSSALLRPVAIWVPWLIVGLVNPFAEEWYWRGLLLDTAKAWSNWLVIPLVSVFFSLNHLLGIGVTSVGGRSPMLLINAFVLGVVYSLIYTRTHSLRWIIVAHIITDLIGLSVPVFLNLWVPPG